MIQSWLELEPISDIWILKRRYLDPDKEVDRIEIGGIEEVLSRALVIRGSSGENIWIRVGCQVFKHLSGEEEGVNV